MNVAGQTFIPDIVYDFWMPRLKPSEFVVLQILLRHDAKIFISISEFVKYTGLTKKTVLAAINSLINHRLVQKITHLHQGENGVNEYRLNTETLELGETK